jgi:hypothetical protein
MKAVLLINHINTMEVIIMIKPSKAKQIMKSVLDGNNVPFLLGGTGVGKSAVVKQLASDLAGDCKVALDEINPDTGVAFTIEEIAARDVPTGHGYKIVQDSEVPVDRSFRDAWTVDDADLTDGTGSGESNLA